MMGKVKVKLRMVTDLRAQSHCSARVSGVADYRLFYFFQLLF